MESRIRGQMFPGTPQGRVKGIDSVGGTYDYHLSSIIQAIHQGQQRSNETNVALVGRSASPAPSIRSKSVKLIEEYDGGLLCFGLLKQSPQVSLCLPDPLAETVAAVSEEEGDLFVGARGLQDPGARVGEDPGHQCLSRARWSVEQNSSRRSQAQSGEHLWIKEGEHDHFLELPDIHVHPSNPIKGQRLTRSVHYGDIQV